MIKRIMALLIFVSVFLVTSALAYDLSDYPNFLYKGTDVNVTLVVGENPKAEDVIGASDIHMSLEYRGYMYKKYNVVGGEKLASEVSYPNTNNIIVGGPCANPFAARLLNLPTTWPECAAGFKEGESRIDLYEKGGKIKILVAGMSPDDTRMATTVFANYKDYNLSGKHLSISEVREGKKRSIRIIGVIRI